MLIFLIYIWLKIKLFDFSENENDTYGRGRNQNIGEFTFGGSHISVKHMKQWRDPSLVQQDASQIPRMSWLTRFSLSLDVCVASTKQKRKQNMKIE